MNNTTQKSAHAVQVMQDERWTRIVARDKSADGTFLYAVKTTGVYCRPSCASRTAKPQNVMFYDSATAAEAEGFRACKRCSPHRQAPLQDRLAKMESLCRYIESAEAAPTLQQLARKANMSAYHLHREFTKTIGVTPKKYAEAHRHRVLRQKLNERPTVTDAMYEAGYSSSGRFYEEAKPALGMKPSAFRKGGQTMEIRFALGETSHGDVLVAQTDVGTCAIFVGDDPQQLVNDLERQFPRALITGGNASLERTVSLVVGMIDSGGALNELPLDIQGTAFQQKIWQALREIPAGATVSYQQIAQTVGMPKAVRAVARACAANKLAVAIPCHRVVRSDGGLSGYRWGIERKAALLQQEGTVLKRINA